MVGAGVSVAVVKSRMVVLVVSHEMGVEGGGGGVAEGSWLCHLATQMVVVVVVAVMVVVKTGIRSVGAGVDADGAHRSTQDRRVSQTGI